MMGALWRRRCGWLGILFAVALSACQTQPAKTTIAPSEQTLRERAQEQLAQGVERYHAGDYDQALGSFQGALDHGLLSRSEQSSARKDMAFIYCLSNREAECRGEFRKALEIDPQFDLTPAEAGHPAWGPVYRSVKAQMEIERAALESKSEVPLPKAKQMLADGMQSYEMGEFAAAQAHLQDALKQGLLDKTDTVKALKYSAFSLCLLGKQSRCRAQFLKIFDIQPDFNLAPAEIGHPSWTRAFAQAKAQVRPARDKSRG
jgi:tetratricopeptide (TPR) repeat protein